MRGGRSKCSGALEVWGGRALEITELIGKARGGDRDASERVFALLYDELRRLAASQLRGEAPMRATSLVHETYLKLARHGPLEVSDRAHYFALAARAMRNIVIDHARARSAARRGGAAQAATLDTTALQIAAEDRGEDVLALDDALNRLAELDAPLAELVEMRFYAGLELTEISGITGRSERSIKRDWRRARAFLQHQIVGA
ncbi:MAG: sigma-70 family RNA polymerase sigma factor [Dokdonella sp.]|uniref:ECF-type sigma factor n=1 Tax=Dokdonella sp. TaxID=2291710 RepID=UPI0025C06CA4|nr:ECF-type sigma factor [Dokdonella sp.]MBZ0223577.1 sigma-70 family RNA polymerase sigma factor [Dokdonella sp.]MCC7255554.1 sigma-70 family RNA polymerase sigma factor [Dokdonella sp.]